MADPTTSNVLLAVPTRGSDAGTWDTPVNANSSASDGFFGGVVTVSVSNSPVTLTAPAGTVTPSAGPTQSQNRILKFTGTLTANVQITLPLPGEYTVQNLTTGNFNLTMIAVGAGKVIATPQGSVTKIWCDGTDVWIFKNAMPTELKFFSGVSALPSWITACTVQPYLLCDGTVYNIATYPALGGLLSSTFGGNGGTTFGVPDLRGRVPLAYDGTGTRITAAGCGLNGQTLGASQDSQTVTLTVGQLPAHNHTITDPGHTHTVPLAPTSYGAAGGGPSAPLQFTNTTTSSNTTGITINNTGSGNAVPNVQPSQVAGIWVIAT